MSNLVRSKDPQSVLTDGQWQTIQALARSLTSEQARWIADYFASGDFAGGNAESSKRKLTVLFATETGTSAEVATALAAKAEKKGLKATLLDIADYKVDLLREEQDILFVISTAGEGDPPQNAEKFFKFVRGKDAPKFENMRYSVLALGDSTYRFFCEPAKKLDQRLEELGAIRLSLRVDCDVDYELPAAAWSDAIVDLLGLDQAATAEPVHPANATVDSHAPALYDKDNPFSAEVLKNILIVGAGSTKATRHIELSLGGSGLTYEPGDAIAITVTNDPAVVSALLSVVALPANAPVKVKGQTLALEQALERHFEITTASPRFLSQWAELTGAEALQQFVKEDTIDERLAFLWNHHVIDIIRQFPASNLDPDILISGLRPLKPRRYSLASSLSAAPNEAHIVIAPVRYELHGEPRSGVASAQLAYRSAPGVKLPVSFQSNSHFRLPADDVPIIMIGAGTGVAPYRAFLQEREARGAKGRSWLFFGERNAATDFLYKSDWEKYLEAKLLTKMDVAFSRDEGSKIYVQHRMRERGAELFAWLQEGAHLYVCGDATNLAPDVHTALIEITAQHGALSPEGAQDYIENLKDEHRYQREVY